MLMVLLSCVYYFVAMEQHHGNILQKALKASGMQVTELARRMKMSRKTVYNRFDAELIDFYELVRFGRVLNHDFSREIPEIAMYQDHIHTLEEGREHYDSPVQRELDDCRKSLVHYKDEAYKLAKELNLWKDKYIEVMEELNRLRQEKNS